MNKSIFWAQCSFGCETIESELIVETWGESVYHLNRRPILLLTVLDAVISHVPPENVAKYTGNIQIIRIIEHLTMTFDSVCCSDECENMVEIF